MLFSAVFVKEVVTRVTSAIIVIMYTFTDLAIIVGTNESPSFVGRRGRASGE